MLRNRRPIKKNAPPSAVQVRGGYSLTPKLKSETTRVGVTLFTVKQEFPAAGLRMLYRDGPSRSAHLPTCALLLNEPCLGDLKVIRALPLTLCKSLATFNISANNFSTI